MNHPHDPRSRAHRVVHEALGIDVAAAIMLPPFDSRLERRPDRPARPHRRKPYVKAEVLDIELEPLTSDAEAGVPDALLAQRSGRTVAQVRKWRRRRGVRGRRSRTSRQLTMMYMLGTLLDRETVHLCHDTSPVKGEWTAPTYVLREPLAYTAFAQICFRLATELDYSSTDIAKGIGVMERDVLHAIAIYEARGSR